MLGWDNCGNRDIVFALEFCRRRKILAKAKCAPTTVLMETDAQIAGSNLLIAIL